MVRHKHDQNVQRGNLATKEGNPTIKSASIGGNCYIAIFFEGKTAL